MSVTKGKSKKTKKWLIFSVSVVVLVAILFSVPVLMVSDDSLYLSSAAKIGTVENYYTFLGSVESAHIQNIMAGKILQIKEIRVSEGDKVEKDDVIFISTDNTKISAKIDGIINKIFVEIDQQVMSGSPLCEIIDFDSLQVSVRVDEYDLETISLGKEIDVYINALNKSVKGKVTEISRTAVSQNGVAFFIAKVSITKDNKIKVGMTAEAKILNQQSKDTIIIPMKALSFDSNNNPFVYLKTDKKTYTKTTVTVGINDGKIVEIKDKLTDGEEIFYKETNKKSNDSRFLPPMPGR